MVHVTSTPSPAQYLLGEKKSCNAFGNLLIYTPSLMAIYTSPTSPNSNAPALKHKTSIVFTNDSQLVLSVLYIPSLNLIFVLFNNYTISAYDENLHAQDTLRLEQTPVLPDGSTAIFEKFLTKSTYISIYKISNTLFQYHITPLDPDLNLLNSVHFTSNHTCLYSPSSQRFSEYNLLQQSQIKNSPLSKSLNALTAIMTVRPYFYHITRYAIILCCPTKLYYIDLQTQTMQTLENFKIYVTGIHQVDKSTVFLSGSDYQIFKLSVSKSNPMSLVSLLINKCSISIQNITSTKDYVFFSSNYTGLLIINKSNDQYPIYLRDKSTISYNREINLLIGIVNTFKIRHNELVSIYTDLRNSIISKNSLDIKFDIKSNLKNATFLGMLDNSPIVKSNHLLLPLDKLKSSQDIKSRLHVITPPDFIINDDDDQLDKIYIIPPQALSKNSNLYSYLDNVLAIFNYDKSITFYTRSYGGFHSKPSRISYTPTNLKIVKVTNKIIDFILFNESTFSTHRYNIAKEDLKHFKTYEWVVQLPIINIELHKTINTSFFIILSANSKLWYLDYTNNRMPKLGPISPSLNFKSLFRVNNHPCTIDSNNNIYVITFDDNDHYHSSDLKLFKSLNSNDKIISVNPVTENLVYIITDNSIYEIKKSKVFPEFETPIKGEIIDYVPYDEDLTFMYTNLGLYVINNADLKIKTFLKLESIRFLKIKDGLISITTCKSDVMDSHIYSLSLILEYSKDANEFSEVMHMNQDSNAEPVFIDPHSNDLFTQFHLGNSHDGTMLYDFPEPYHSNYISVDEKNLICYISTFQNLIIMHRSNLRTLMKFKNIKDAYLNNDNNLLVYRNRRINLIDLDSMRLLKGVKIKSGLKIIWINKMLLTVKDEKLSARSGTFLKTLTPDLMYEEHKISEQVV